MRRASQKVAIVFLLAAAGLTAQERPESWVGKIDDQLAFGQVALGMTIAQVERVVGHKVTLAPIEDDTGLCSGVIATELRQSHRTLLTFAKRPAEFRLVQIFVPFAHARDFGTMAAALKRQIPELRTREGSVATHSGDMDKAFWELSRDPAQTVLISSTEGIWISRGCID